MSESWDYYINNFNTDNINLTQTNHGQKEEQVATPLPSLDAMEQSPSQSKTKNTKVCRLAQRIANTDVLVKQQIELRRTANEINTLYQQEKEQRLVCEQEAKLLKKRCEELENEVSTYHLKVDQLQAQLEEESPPIKLKQLITGYISLASHINEANACCLNKNDKKILRKLKEYCAEKNIKVVQKTRQTKRTLTENSSLDSRSSAKSLICSERPTICDQSSQCLIRDTGEKHEITTSNRSTKICNLVETRDIGTNIPDVDTLPSCSQILDEMLSWQVTPLSPINDPPLIDEPYETRIPTVETQNIGPCAHRRENEHIPPVILQIKRSDSRPPSRVGIDILKNEHNIIQEQHNEIQKKLHHAINTHLEAIYRQQSMNRSIPLENFTELWQLFGQLVLGLLQSQAYNTSLVLPPSNLPCNFNDDISTNQMQKNFSTLSMKGGNLKKDSENVGHDSNKNVCGETVKNTLELEKNTKGLPIHRNINKDRIAELFGFNTDSSDGEVESVSTPKNTKEIDCRDDSSSRTPLQKLDSFDKYKSLEDHQNCLQDKILKLQNQTVNSIDTPSLDTKKMEFEESGEKSASNFDGFIHTEFNETCLGSVSPYTLVIDDSFEHKNQESDHSSETCSISTVLNSTMVDDIVVNQKSKKCYDILNTNEPIATQNQNQNLKALVKGKRKYESCSLNNVYSFPCKRMTRSQARRSEEGSLINSISSTLGDNTKDTNANHATMDALQSNENQEQSIPTSLGYFRSTLASNINNTICDKNESIKETFVIKDALIQSHNETVLNTHSGTTSTSTDMLIFESPRSPSPEEPIGASIITKQIPLERSVTTYCRWKSKSISLLEHIDAIHRQEAKKKIGTAKIEKQRKELISKMSTCICQYLQTTLKSEDLNECKNLVNQLQKLSLDVELISTAFVEQFIELSSIKLDIEVLTRIRNVVLDMEFMFPLFTRELLLKIENKLFKPNEKPSLVVALNLTQIYLHVIRGNALISDKNDQNPARLLIAKHLYHFPKHSGRLVFEVLCCYPTVLPHRDERTYAHDDPLITVIKHLLMNYNYDMEDTELCGKQMLSKLRFEYHFKAYEPSQTVVLRELIEKLKAGQLNNLSLAFPLFCKRLPVHKVINEVLNAELVPLAQDYYKKASVTSKYDERIELVLNCISTCVKPLPLETDVSVYLKLFAHFLNTTQRPVIQEAALQSILRLQRFGYATCEDLIKQYRPTFKLKSLTYSMLRTYVAHKQYFYKNKSFFKPH